MTVIVRSVQSQKEVRAHAIDFANDLPTGVTVSSVALTHTGPSSETPTSAISGSIVNVTLSTPAVGQHYVRVLATLSNSEISEAMLAVKVRL
jgi:hypothetical protein